MKLKVFETLFFLPVKCQTCNTFHCCRVEVEGASASSVSEAIKVLSIAQDEKVDKHPEKRMKAAYTEFEERRLEELKAENKSLKLSQLKQMIFKEWQKHPDNPLNKQ